MNWPLGFFKFYLVPICKCIHSESEYVILMPIFSNFLYIFHWFFSKYLNWKYFFFTEMGQILTTALNLRIELFLLIFISKVILHNLYIFSILIITYYIICTYKNTYYKYSKVQISFFWLNKFFSNLCA
jgi:hypothetical protein